MSNRGRVSSLIGPYEQRLRAPDTAAPSPSNTRNAWLFSPRFPGLAPRFAVRKGQCLAQPVDFCSGRPAFPSRPQGLGETNRVETLDTLEILSRTFLLVKLKIVSFS